MMANAMVWGCLLLKTLVCLQTLAGHADRQGAQQNVTVVILEGGTAILPCSLKSQENITRKLFDWKRDGRKEVFLYASGETYLNGRVGQDVQYNGRISYFPEELKHGNASLLLKDARLADAGSYSCHFPRQKRPMSYVKLIVGAAPQPHTKIVDAVGDRVLLNCSVRGASPRPEMEWQDDNGNVLPAAEPQISEDGEGRYNIDLNATVTKTKTNRYRCIVKQEAIGHITHDEIYVPEKMFYDDTFCLGRSIVLGLALVVLLTMMLMMMIRSNRKRDTCSTCSANSPSKEPLTPDDISEVGTDAG